VASPNSATHPSYGTCRRISCADKTLRPAACRIVYLAFLPPLCSAPAPLFLRSRSRVAASPPRRLPFDLALTHSIQSGMVSIALKPHTRTNKFPHLRWRTLMYSRDGWRSRYRRACFATVQTMFATQRSVDEFHFQSPRASRCRSCARNFVRLPVGHASRPTASNAPIHGGPSRCCAASASYPKRDGFNRVQIAHPDKKEFPQLRWSPL
jgi:hypothetical protein